MLPIYVMYDSGLNSLEESAIRSGLAELSEIMPGRRIINYGKSRWSDGDYGSADWYVEKATHVIRPGIPMQLNAHSLIELMWQEPWQRGEKHIDVFFTSKDLTARNDYNEWLNFCFGMTSGRFTVQSVAGFRGLPRTERVLAIKSVMWHELGHVLGAAASLTRPNTTDKLGPHCTNYGCVMQQGMTVPEFVQHAREAERRGRIYCNECMKDIKKSRI